MNVYYVESQGSFTCAWRRSYREANALARDVRAKESTAVKVTKYRVPPFTKDLVLKLVGGEARKVLKAVRTWKYPYDPKYTPQYAQAGATR